MPTPLVLESTTVTNADAPLEALTFVVVPLHVVASSVPTPSLVDGRPV